MHTHFPDRVPQSRAQAGNCMSDSLWLLILGPEDDVTGEYAYAVFSGPFLITLSVLARDGAGFAEKYEPALLPQLYDMGFRHPLNRPVPVPHTSCAYPPDPAESGSGTPWPIPADPTVWRDPATQCSASFSAG